MKLTAKFRVTIFFLFVLAMVFPAVSLASTNKWLFPGTMFKLYDGEGTNNLNFPSLCPACGPMGGIFVIGWNRLQSGEGGVDFTKLEDHLRNSAQMQTAVYPDGSRKPKPIVFELSFFRGAGDFTPGFIYQHGVSPKTAVCGEITYQVPPYDNLYWKTQYLNTIRALGAHFNNRNFPNLAGFIISTGFDDESYPIPSWCSDANASAGYNAFLKEVVATVGESFTVIPAYVPSGGEITGLLVPEALDHNVGLKSNTLSVGREHCCFAWNGSGDPWSFLGNPSNANNSMPHSAAMNTNEQITWAFEDARGWDFTHTWDTYYQWLIPLSLHADWIDWRDIRVFQTMASAYPYFTSTFVPLYLGRTKATTPGVWTAFRDIKNRTVYNTASGDEIICWNGGCHSHKIGDLEYYLRKVGDSGSSVVFWENLPAPAQSQPYGFGRSLSEGKYLSLKVEDGVWFKSQPGNLRFRIIVLNSGTGSLGIEFRGVDGSLKRETIVKGGNLGEADKFVEVWRDVSGIKFDNSLANGGDVVVTAIAGTSVIHLLELKPGRAGIPSIPPANTSTTAPALSLTPTATPTLPAGVTATLTPMLTLSPTLSPTPSPTPIPRSNFAEGWNLLTWQAGWPNYRFADLPWACSYVVYQADGWQTYVRDYSSEDSSKEKFVSGQSYYVYCLTQTSWWLR